MQSLSLRCYFIPNYHTLFCPHWNQLVTHCRIKTQHLQKFPFSPHHTHALSQPPPNIPCWNPNPKLTPFNIKCYAAALINVSPSLIVRVHVRMFLQWMNEWMNEWMIYIVLLLCIVVHPKRFTIMWQVSPQPPPACSIHHMAMLESHNAWKSSHDHCST